MTEKMTLRKGAERIREIDKRITALFNELHSLYRDGITQEEHVRLFNLVTNDGKSHWM